MNAPAPIPNLTPEAARFGSQEIADKVEARRAYIRSLISGKRLPTKPLPEPTEDAPYDPVFEAGSASLRYWGRI